MSYESDLSLLAAGSFGDIRREHVAPLIGEDRANHAPLPAGWALLPIAVSGSGENSSFFGSRFSARAYQNTSTREIVISYAGTGDDRLASRADNGQFAGRAMHDNASASTGTQLIITKGARSCVRQAWSCNRSGSNSYVFNSCSRFILLGYKAKRHAKSTLAKLIGGVNL